jgi:hypothetical protein
MSVRTEYEDWQRELQAGVKKPSKFTHWGWAVFALLLVWIAAQRVMS